ncbi:hypothetical protein [Lichenihabitans psoromatis]|uniref:hypothetical protein n=1 Tax=Lichenihabitans psoromatis TaxID=2528642 RepID=UPI0010383FBF|nr:hypothetical protein [Lichenihabitans psoromatis]
MSKVTRRQVLGAALAGSLGAALAPMARAATGGAPIVGAIRWDAWYDPDGQIGKAVEASLGPSQFHSRMPFFGKATDADHVRIDGNHQDVMDREIQMAKAAGLSYWAYCWYPQDSPMQNAWRLHQSSSIKDKMNWCLLWQFSNLGGRAAFEKNVPQVVKWLAQTNYQVVPGKRPLIYFNVDQPQTLAKWQNDWGTVAAALDMLRAACAAAGVAKPYLVVMNGSAEQAGDVMQKLGGDAISNYIAQTPKSDTPSFDDLRASAQRYWADMARHAPHIVPIVMTGWDTRPRKLNTPFWEHAPKRGQPIHYVPHGGQGEIKAAIGDATQYVRANPAICPSGLVLVYSWNECDEGGGCLVSVYAGGD